MIEDIEVLVTQDKLSCCGATTMWVSSERQYSDGLTKQSAAQLLADRMRPHLVKLKSDESFQAAKRKDAKERKKSAEMYASKKGDDSNVCNVYGSNMCC